MTTIHATSQTLAPGDQFWYERLSRRHIAVFMYRTPVSMFTDRVTYHWFDETRIRHFVCSTTNRYELVLT